MDRRQSSSTQQPKLNYWSIKPSSCDGKTVSQMSVAVYHNPRSFWKIWITLWIYWQRECEICHELSCFQMGLLVLLLCLSLFTPAFCASGSGSRCECSQQTDWRTRKKGNNERMDAFILLKGINAKAFILSIIPLKSPLHSCRSPHPPSFPYSCSPRPIILASLLASEGLTNPFKGNHRKQYSDPKKTMAVPFSSVFVI